MKRFYALLVLCISLSFSLDLLAQPWSYDFGTGTGTANNTNSGSGNTTFFTSTPSGGGTYRVRIGTGGGSLALVNPGSTLGSGTEAVLTATTATSTNKFTVYGWTSPSAVAYAKVDLRTSSTGNGIFFLHLGTGAAATIYQDNTAGTSYNVSLAVLRLTYAGGALTGIDRRISGSFSAIASSGIAAATDQTIEIYGNNASSSTSYFKSGTNTLNAQSWDLWVAGTKISPSGGWPVAGTLAAGTNLAGIGFFGESSSTPANGAVMILDNLEYSNSLPVCPAPTTQVSAITFPGVTTSTLDVSWTSGDGSGRVVKMNSTNSFTAPTNGSNPTANLAWANAGEQVIYNGTASGPITVTGLNQGTTYFFRAYEYCDAGRTYQTATATGNENSQATASGPGLSTGVLTAFGAQCTGSSYGPNMFTITGSNLTTADVTVTCAISQYEFATSAGGPYSSSLTLSQGGGSYSQDIYVQFTPSAVATYNGNIVVSGGGASSVNVAVSGSGIASAAPTVNSPASAVITSTSAELSATIPSINCSDVTTRGFEWSTLSGFTNGAGTPVTETGTFGTGTYTLTATGLPSNTTIYWKAFATNSTGTTYTAQQSFTTAQEFLSIGDISIIAMNTNGTADNFAFVNWVSIPANMVIKFTDNGFNGTAPNSANTAGNGRSTENFVIWKNTTGLAIDPGTVIRIEGVTATLGTASAGSAAGLGGLSNTGEQIFAYQGSATSGAAPDYAAGSSASTTFNGSLLYGIHVQGTSSASWLTTGTATSNDSYLPTELNVTNGNIVLNTNTVGGQYTGTRSALGSIIAYRTLVNNPANWTKVTGSSFVTVNTTAFTVNPNVATQIAVTDINGGINPSANTPFTVSFEARDASNAPASVGVDTDFQITLATGSGALAGTLTGTITAGSGTLTITGVLYNTAETGVSVTVSSVAGQSLTAGTSSTFTVEAAADHLAFVNLENFVYTSNVIPNFSVQALRPDNSLDVNYSGSATISLLSGTGSLLGTLTKTVTAGVAFFNDIEFDATGVKQIEAVSGVLGPEASSNITVSTASLTEIILPEFIEGKQPTNTNRVPYVYRVTLSGLKPNSTFRYINSVVLATDAATSNGAGNAIYVDGAGFVRSGGTSLSSAGNYGEFTTDGSGSYTGWFITEPTGNSTRFNPGADVYPRIILNNGNGGSAPTARLTTTNSVKVIEFGSLLAQGTALVGSSFATARDFVFVYNNTAGSGRPVSGSFVESDGSLNDNATNSYSTFYSTSVDGIAGAYGMIIPNNLPNGIRRIESRDRVTGDIAGCSSTDADGIWPSGVNTVNPNTGTTPKVITSSDAPLVASPESCGNYIDDNCDGAIDELCPGNFQNDIPGGAINVAFSSNAVYPNCYAITGDNTLANNSAESVAFDGPDSWYRFTAQSSAVSITMTSSTMDDAIAVYTKSGYFYTLVDSENASSGAGDFERLNLSGLTPGVTYYVSAGAADGVTGGSFTLCIQHLMPSWCAFTIPASGFNLCNSYKAIYRGSPAQGVTYGFSFTGTGGGASGTTSVSGTNGLIILSNPALGLRYGGMYNVQVDVNYALQNSAAVTENILVAGSVSSPNCEGVVMRAQPLMEVRSSQRCPASLLRSNWLIGSPVTGDPNPCAAVNYTYEFTQVVSCLDTTQVSVNPVEYTTVGNTAYLGLGVLPNLSSSGAWKVRIRPNFSYGNGSYGPARFIQVANTSASVMLPEENVFDENERSASDLIESAVYPNPNNGQIINLNVTGFTTDRIPVRILDATGRVVYANTFVAEGSLNVSVDFAQPLSNGLYMIEMIVDGESRMEKMLVQH